MNDEPWAGDASSLVDEFRAGDRSPLEELDASLAAIDADDLNCFSFVDPERARRAAAAADLTLPFGGVPTAIKELDAVEGWPHTEASMVFADRKAAYTSLHIERLLGDGGAVPVGLTTASEFGGLNVSVTRLNGVTHNPWRHDRTVGGSSGGSAAAVSGGLVSLASGGDGGGSIRIPAGYTGLLGMKGTFGRLPRSPRAYARPNTVVFGNLSRSVRDAARFFDVCGGYDARDPSSLPRHPGYEAGLGSQELAGRRVAIIPGLGGVPLEEGVESHVRSEAEALVAETGMELVDLEIDLPRLSVHWMLGNMATLLADLDGTWPGCLSLLTDEIRAGLLMSRSLYNLDVAAMGERLRMEANIAMGEAFEQVDFVIASTNPGPAFAAEATMSNPNESVLEKAMASNVAKTAMRGGLGGMRVLSSAAPGLPNRLIDRVVDFDDDLASMGGLTMISNLYGNPAVSIPAGTVNGLPVGLQVLGRHHQDELVFDVALAKERSRPWPMVAPPSGF